MYMPENITKKTMRISVVGAGKIAHSLVPALQAAGYIVNAVFSKTERSAVELAEKFNIGIFSNDLSALPNNSSLIFLAVPDSQIKTAARLLSRSNSNLNNKIIAHLSGSLTTDELNILREKGALTASFHIMQTFPERKSVDINDCYCAIETDDKKADKVLFTVAADLKLKPFKISSTDKILYHLLGVVSSNFQISNFIAAEKISRNIKSNIPPVVDLVFPTAFTTLLNIKSKGVNQSLSGPIERGEIEIIKEHIRKIKKDKLLALNYILASLNLLEAAKSKSAAKSENHNKIKKYLMKQLHKYTRGF